MKPEYTSDDQAAAWNDGYQAAIEEFGHEEHPHRYSLISMHPTGGRFTLSVEGENLRVTYDDENGIIGVPFHLRSLEKLLVRAIEAENQHEGGNDGKHSRTVQ